MDETTANSESLESAWFDTMSMPALLRAARTPYRRAVRRGLADAGFDDLPRNGAFVLGGMARENVPLSEVVTGVGLSKQAVGLLVDALVGRGYLVRVTDDTDGRRVRLDLTERGAAAADAVRSAVEDVDAALWERIGGDAVHQGRATLGALAEMGRRSDG